MRIFVSFENTVHAVDVSVGEVVGEIKKSLQEKFGINLKNSQNKNDSFVALMHQGTNLQDNWTYSDLGIPAGTILACRIEKRVEPTLKVFCPRYDEAIEYKESFRVWQTLVSDVRVMIQDSTGIHVSAFRLFSPKGVELFDCHPLKVYGIHAGDTVTMEIWHDVADLVKTARADDITDTLEALASFHEAPQLLRYHLQLGLFIAAHFGYHQLATQLIKCGARPSVPVGQHPSRDWCSADAHPDNAKTPAHEAAQHGRFMCLHHFLVFNYAVLICKDAHGLTPCNVARKHKQTECFKLLIAEQFRIPTVSGLSINVYSRVRKWCDRARDRARVHKDKTTLLLLTNAEHERRTAIVGQKVRVDGYSNGEVKQQGDNSKDQRNRKRVTGSSRSSSRKSQMNKETARVFKENPKGVPKMENSHPSPLKVKSKQEVVCITPSNGAAHQTTKNRSVTLDSARVTCMSRSSSTLSRNKALTAEGKRDDSSKGRYVWKPIQPTDCVKDNGGDGVGLKDDRGWPRIVADGINGQSVATEDRYLKHASDSERSARNESGNANKETHVRKDQHGRETGTRRKPSFNTPNKAAGTKLETKPENEPLTRAFDTTQSDRQSKSVNNERRTRRSLSSGCQPTNFPMGMERRDSENKLGWTSPLNRLQHQRSIDSAEECMRVARETYHRKSWLGQLQMALVVNTNMYKRGSKSSVNEKAVIPEQ